MAAPSTSRDRTRPVSRPRCRPSWSPAAWVRPIALIEQVGLLPDDQVVKGLILEPGNARVAYLLARNHGSIMRDGNRLACGLCHQLRLATAIHRDVVKGRLVHRAPNRQVSVVLHND